MAAADRPGWAGVARGADQGCRGDQPAAPSQRGRGRQGSGVGDRLQASSAGGVLADAQPLPHVTDLLTALRDRGPDVTRPSWWSSTRQRRYAGRCSTSLTTRYSVAASCTRSATCATGCPSGCARPWPNGCAPPTTPPRSSRRSTAHRAGPRAGQDPPGCGRQPARGTRDHLGPRLRPFRFRPRSTWTHLPHLRANNPAITNTIQKRDPRVINNPLQPVLVIIIQASTRRRHICYQYWWSGLRFAGTT
jgi:hypothetical protein